MTGHADGCHDSGRRNDNAKGLPKRCCCAHLRKADERRGKLRTFGRWADIVHVLNDGRALRHAPACGMFLSMVNGWWCRVMVPGGGASWWCQVLVPGGGVGCRCRVVVPRLRRSVLSARCPLSGLWCFEFDNENESFARTKTMIN